MRGRYVLYTLLIASGETALSFRKTIVTIDSFNLKSDEPAVYHVNQDGYGDVRSISEAIMSAIDGDMIVIHPGIYFEAVEIAGKNITLTSTDPTDPEVVETTVIDGEEKRRPITFSGTESEDCRIIGLTIANGSAKYGAGISCGPPSGPYCGATIENCIIRDNEASQSGGAVAWGHGRIINCLLQDNYAKGPGGGVYRFDGELNSCFLCNNDCGGDGGGIYDCDGDIVDCLLRNNGAGIPFTGYGHGSKSGGGLFGCDGEVVGCTIEQNSARGGGGLSECQGLIFRCTIQDNHADWGAGLHSCNGIIDECVVHHNIAGYTLSEDPPGEGAGIASCDGVISNCIISSNEALLRGGGLAFCDADVNNCLIYGNIAKRFDGGGLMRCDGQITNCTIVGNSTTAAEGMGGGLNLCEGSIADCIIWGNTAETGPNLYECPVPSFSCIEGWEGEGEGNISYEPLFALGPLGEYYLNPSSPCVDAGSKSAAEAGLSYKTTQADGTPDTGRVDMGFHYPIEQ